MSDGGGTARLLAERTLRTCLRGMLLAVTAVACLPLFVFALVSVVTIASGLGLVIAPKMLLAVRWQADLERRRALEWSGVTIAAPYRPEPQSGNRLMRGLRRGMWVLKDPATWRDLLWTLAGVPVSVVLGLLPALLVGVGAWALADDAVFWAGAVRTAPHGFLVQVLLLGMLPLGVVTAPWLLKTHARAWVQLEYEPGKLVAIVGDNGTGGAAPRADGGLRGIERRLSAFDGMVAVTSPIGGPTQVTMELPCELSLART